MWLFCGVNRWVLFLSCMQLDFTLIRERIVINGLWPCLTSTLKNLLCYWVLFPLITLLTSWPPPLPFQPTISAPLLTLLIPPSSSINLLFLSPYKTPPLLFVGACLIAITVTPYYISNDWLWALIRDMLGDLTPSFLPFCRAVTVTPIAAAAPLARHL